MVAAVGERRGRDAGRENPGTDGQHAAVLLLIVTNALSAVGAIVILLIGLWLSGKTDLLVVRVLSRTPRFDPTLKSFFGSLARYLTLTVTLLAVLSQFAIQTTSVLAVISAASLAVGPAFRARSPT
jgi:small conductance mechanosensitive channel